MQRASYSETWTVKPLGSAGFTVPELFALTGLSSFALLYGDGPNERWLVFAEDPLVILASPHSSPYSIERHGPVPPIRPDFIGHLSYEWAYLRESLLPAPLENSFPFPLFRFCLYRHVVLVDRRASVLYECERTGQRICSPEVHGLSTGPFSAKLSDSGDSREAYTAKVSAVRDEIRAGKVYQACLTRQEEWAYDGDMRSFALDLYKSNPAPFSAMIAAPGHAVVSSSPERFVRLADGRLAACPIKGTAPRGNTPEEDRALADELLASGKNLAELAMIVDLLRNDLSRACVMPSVVVDAFPVLQSYANVHHLVAIVSGRVKPGLTLEALLAALFPGGSVTGCPKLAAMQLIRRLEAHPRMLYTGALGWFSAEMDQLDFNIPIRSVWASDSRLRFGVGGAVVWDSDPDDEYEETLHKGRSIVTCLSS